MTMIITIYDRFIISETGHIDSKRYDLHTVELFRYFPYVVLMTLAIGIFYGVAYKIPAYQVLLENLVKKFKGKENICLAVIMTLIAVIVSVSGLSFGIIFVFPFVISLVLLMGYNKLVAASVTVGSTIVGILGTTIGSNTTYYINAVLSTEVTNEMITKVVILVVALVLLIYNVLAYAKKTKNNTDKVVDFVPNKTEGKEEKIAIGGSTEIRHLGQSIQESYRQNSELMKKVIWEQNERRKSEFDVLQSQINPHFLYNTLDSITWMIESGKNEEAAFMITQLAKLFRISLSKGHTVIRIRDELQHAQSYVNIQKVRYKNKFEVVFDIRPDILDDCIVKLVLQPILENAINYGVREMDDCGKILIRGWKEQENIFMQVSDNGMGIPEEEIDLLLKDTNRVHKKGS